MAIDRSQSRFLWALVALLAAGLLAAGCGDDDEGDTTPAAGVTGEAGATGAGGALEEDDVSIGIDDDASPGEVYDQCLEALEGLGYNSDFPCRQVQRNYDDCVGQPGCADMAADTIENLVRAGEPE